MPEKVSHKDTKLTADRCSLTDFQSLVSASFGQQATDNGQRLT